MISLLQFVTYWNTFENTIITLNTTILRQDGNTSIKL